jgi:hypothetical protein
VTTGEPLQRALPPPSQLLDAIRDFRKQHTGGTAALMVSFNSTLLCSVTVPDS